MLFLSCTATFPSLHICKDATLAGKYCVVLSKMKGTGDLIKELTAIKQTLEDVDVGFVF